MNKKLLRLKADERIGNRHITVQRHISLTYPLHWHNYFEIEIIVEGAGAYIFNGKSYPISKGDAFLLTPVDFHEIDRKSVV